jgi:ketosteroid isomerase-like protein
MDDTRLLDAVMAAYNAHDVEGVIAHFVPDAVFEAPSGPGPAGATYVGHEAIAAALRARFEASPDVRWEVEENWVAGTRGYSSWRVTWTGPDGALVDRRGCDLFEIRDGAIARKDSFFKQLMP